jgi:hypothetical protein
VRAACSWSKKQKIRPLKSPPIDYSHVLQIPLVLLSYQVPSPVPQDPALQSIREMDLPLELLRHHERAHLLPALVDCRHQGAGSLLSAAGAKALAACRQTVLVSDAT